MSALMQPGAHEIGRVSTNLQALLSDTLDAWNAGIALIPDTDPDAPSRRRGRTNRDVLMTVGQWPGTRSLSDMRQAAVAGDHSIPPRRLLEAELRHNFAHASVADIAQSWAHSRDDIAQWSASGAAADDAHLLIGGPIGVVPLGTLVGASAFHICTAIRDTNTSSAADDDRLIRLALHALIDTAGAISANYLADRSASTSDNSLSFNSLSLRAITPQIRVGMGARAGSWRTALLPDPASGSGPTISGNADVIIDIAAARRSPITASARRDITVQDVGGLLDVATALASAPDLPGGDALRAAVSTARGAGSLGRMLKSRFIRKPTT